MRGVEQDARARASPTTVPPGSRSARTSSAGGLEPRGEQRDLRRLARALAALERDEDAALTRRSPSSRHSPRRVGVQVAAVRVDRDERGKPSSSCARAPRCRARATRPARPTVTCVASSAAAPPTAAKYTRAVLDARLAHRLGARALADRGDDAGVEQRGRRTRPCASRSWARPRRPGGRPRAASGRVEEHLPREPVRQLAVALRARRASRACVASRAVKTGPSSTHLVAGAQRRRASRATRAASMRTGSVIGAPPRASARVGSSHSRQLSVRNA